MVVAQSIKELLCCYLEGHLSVVDPSAASIQQPLIGRFESRAQDI